MQRIDIDADRWRMIDRFESVDARHLALARTSGPGTVGLIVLGPDGVLGRHPAVGDQLFIVTAGEGWVAGPDGHRIEVTAGDTVVSTRGELHESGSRVGMTALVVEATSLEIG